MLWAGMRGPLPLQVPGKVATCCLWGPPLALSAGPAGHSMCDRGLSLLGEDRVTDPDPGRGAVGMLGMPSGLWMLMFSRRGQPECFPENAPDSFFGNFHIYI